MSQQMVLVASVGMLPFVKPIQRRPCREMDAEAARLVLGDVGLPYDQVEFACAGQVHSDSPCGQRVLYLCGTAEARQVAGARNLGLGGACVVTLYKKA